MLVAFEKCKLKFTLDSNVRVGKGPNYEFNPNSFLGNFIHKVLETYYTEFYELELFDSANTLTKVAVKLAQSFDQEYDNIYKSKSGYTFFNF